MAGSVTRLFCRQSRPGSRVKSFQNGGRIANLRIATSENWKDKQTGEKKERTEWHTVAAPVGRAGPASPNAICARVQVYIGRPAAHPQVAGRLGQRSLQHEVSVADRGVLTMLDSGAL